MCRTWVTGVPYRAHKKRPTTLGPPKGPRHGPTVGSYGEAVSYKQGTPAGDAAGQPAVEQTRHMYDSQDQIMALAFQVKVLKPF